MKQLKIFVVIDSEQLPNFKLSNLEGENVESIVLINDSDQEENIAQLLESNLVVTYTEKPTKLTSDFLTIARILDRTIIHFSRIKEYVS